MTQSDGRPYLLGLPLLRIKVESKSRGGSADCLGLALSRGIHLPFGPVVHSGPWHHEYIEIASL